MKITVENAEYQIIEALKNNRNKRTRMKEVFVEGIESIKQAVSAEVVLSRIIFHDFDALSDWAKSLIRNNRSAESIEMSYGLYRKLCDRSDPSELVVTAKVEYLHLDQVSISGNPFVLIFDRPSDHGNFGSIVRSANSFHVDAIFIVGHGVDYYDPKVIRSSLGSVFHSKIISIPSMKKLEEWIRENKTRNGVVVVGTDSAGEVSLADNPLRKPIALVLGNEAKGMSVALKNICDYIVSIPVEGEVNSLNVACAGSIFLWDIYRNSRSI